eukprot:TRINITY_DN15327_c1_g1_i1.p2 TRINITY_DN15327_c1_g1~~TRINITY_DN15327_c1_g1_i1.p2  ORF type:complete len:399 (+),score=163.13 TRINITY_DN15327_c1_g1_i1:77-1273(+)
MAQAPAAASEGVAGAVGALRAAAGDDAAFAAVSLLLRMTRNVRDHPSDDKYRSVRAAAPAFQSAVAGSPEGRTLLRACGWALRRPRQGGEPVAVLPESEGPAALLAALAALEECHFDLAEARREREEQRVASAHAAHLREERRREELLERRRAVDAAADAAPAVGDADALSRIPAAELETLAVLLRNPLLWPDEPKYRRLRRANGRLAPLLQGPAGELLRSAGFAPGEDGDYVLGDPARLAGALRSVDEALRLQAERDAADFAEQSAALQQQGAQQRRRREEEERARPVRPMSAAEQERLLTATRLISDVQGLMEQDWLLRGAVGVDAQFRKEGRALLESFKADGDLERLHRLKDHWERKVEQTKRDTGRTMVNTIYCRPDPETGKPHPSSFVGKNLP